MNAELERIKSIKSFPSLVKYLREDLEWKIEVADDGDLVFEYDADELGIDRETAAKIKEIKQLRPLVSNQPWGVFYIEFDRKRLPIVALRRILRSLVIKKRESANRSQMATWEQNDLLFISSYGEQDNRELTFAHFSDNTGMGDLPTLKVLGWSAGNTVLRLEDTYKTLNEKLHWPEDDADVQAWREQWSSAFKLQYRETVRTAKDLAIRLADLAIVIRDSVNDVLAIETEKGELRKLYSAFKEALIHDLTEDDFADMYAQTIAYGLLSARFSRTSGALVADNLSDLIPNTNPFLKELMQTFLTVGGRKSKIDFDELGINEVVELLRNANMEEVLKDFGAKNPNEDPVIHFYELFLKEYDPEKRMKRGVFYTPRPVVSFIVRSVDEILRNEFGLADGLADTTTWGDMRARNKDLVIPEGVKESAPFVQILDPATGTGTFLVEVIDRIAYTMKSKWGASLGLQTPHDKEGVVAWKNKQVLELWNEYVPEHLLPRLYGFELMMAPYSIAHMKIGLKLRETGYSFISSERAQIYLTNTLEEAKDFSGYLATMAPALAHEAADANRVKRTTPITVVIGNPPYSISSQNKSMWILSLIQDYKRDLVERKLNLDDDYIKFVRYAEQVINKTNFGVFSFITNNSYLDGLVHRKMREHLLETFSLIDLIDLHGSTVRRERCEDGTVDENVFEIQQGVAILVGRHSPNNKEYKIRHADIWGNRLYKYSELSNDLENEEFSVLDPSQPFWFFEPKNFTDKDEYELFESVSNIFRLKDTGIQTKRDKLTVHYSRAECWEAVEKAAKCTPEELIQFFGLQPDGRDWKAELAIKDLASTGPDKKLLYILNYRPFDFRWTYYTGKTKGFIAYPRLSTQQHLISLRNLALIYTRQFGGHRHFITYCTRNLTEMSSQPYASYVVNPLYVTDSSLSLLRNDSRESNLDSAFVERFQKLIGEISPEDLFHYIYAILHSPRYRQRYSEFLKVDFPRIPLTSDSSLFHDLCQLGADLVALHLLEGEYAAASWNIGRGAGQNPLEKPYLRLSGKSPEVNAGYPKFDNGNVYINEDTRFEGVEEEVWNFHIGGYQVCHKWLKDRKGRTLSPEDIAHYGKTTVALRETIRLMAEIDEVIDAHGGFPLVGSQAA